MYVDYNYVSECCEFTSCDLIINSLFYSLTVMPSALTIS